MNPHAEIISVGRELLIGKVVNSNATWLCQQLTKIGVIVRRITVIADDLNEIASAIRESLNRNSQLIITTGGLGPTDDDMTLKGVAQALGRALKLNYKALKMIEESYLRILNKAQKLSSHQVKMAYLPENAIPIANPIGTAPACLLKINESIIVCLPGVPEEMKQIFAKSIIPLIKEKFGIKIFQEKSFFIEGLREAQIAPIITEASRRFPEAYFKSHPDIKNGKPLIELHISSSKPGILLENISEIYEFLRKKIGRLGGRIRE